MNIISSYKNFFIQSFIREVKSKYINSTFGFLWLFLNPILQLFIYYFVFEKIFQIKFNIVTGHSFLSFITVGLWSWIAFSEGLISATNSIEKHKALLQKIKVPSFLFVLLEVVVPFAIHFIGLIFILFVIKIFFNQPISLFYIPIFFIVYMLNMLLCFGLGLILSSLQVFLKDIAQILNPFIMIWFYVTPIIYPADRIPNGIKPFMAINPINQFIESYRKLLLEGIMPSVSSFIIMFLIVIFFIFIGLKLFNRLETKFEDMF